MPDVFSPSETARSRQLEYAARYDARQDRACHFYSHDCGRQNYDASESDPHYEVESEKSGKHAVHRSDALRHLED
ncbi:DUF2945 domain-containing protein [Paraburkholderia strydomiana]|uniref:DUF2945 domain-containing protein n=1 Tax=Paraburkholderia strydomiana TaxID=1245417 RepID=A0ABW9EGF0_9BURK